MKRVHRMARRRALRWCLALAGAGGVLALSACAGLTGPPHLSYSESDLNRLLDRRFPLERRVLETIDVTLTQPRLSLKPSVGRVATEFDLQADDRLFGHHWRGHLALDYGLRLDRHDHSLRMVEPHVQTLSLDGGASAQAQRLGGLVLERVLDGFVIVQLKPEQVERLSQAGYELGDVKVRDGSVEITAVARQ